LALDGRAARLARKFFSAPPDPRAGQNFFGPTGHRASRKADLFTRRHSSAHRRKQGTEPRASLNASADVPASPDDSGETASTKQTAPASSGSAPKPADCPPTLTIPFKRGGVQPIIADDIQGHLERLREWLNRHPEKKLAVEGHADTKGSERHNLLLSYRRAKAVVGFLNKAGVSERQIAILAAGETAPIEGIPADSDDNRRVILQVEGAENCQDFSTKSEGL
jgi:outer membrane protein OmpA-like peptidoglycan-associated protein